MTDEKRPLKVFLCHASADKPKVRELYRYLKRRGLQPWLDAEDLLPGQNWQVEIPKALEASDAIIICLSKGSVDKEGYVQKEIKFALDRTLEMPEGRIFLIPTRLEECDVPRSLSAYHWVDLFNDAGYEKLMKSLKLRALQLGCSTVQAPKENKAKPEKSQRPEMGLSDNASMPSSSIDDIRWENATPSQIFNYRLMEAFPGLRGFKKFEREEAVNRLQVLFRESLVLETALDKETPFWWLRGIENSEIERFERVNQTKILLDACMELNVDYIIAVRSFSDRTRNFIYVQITPEELTGLYKYSEDWLKDYLQNQLDQGYGYFFNEEYGIWGENLITRSEYDDGSAIIDGKPIRIKGAKLRIRYVTPYNFLICGQDHILNDSDVDLKLTKLCNEMLLGTKNIDDLINFVKNLPRRKLSKSFDVSPIKIHNYGTISGKFAENNENDALSQNITSVDERLAETELVVPTSSLKKESHKLKTEYIIAIIGAAATILAALIGILPQFFKPVPVPTAIISATMTETLAPKNTNTALFLPTFKPPIPSLTPTKLMTSTVVTPATTATLAIMPSLPLGNWIVWGRYCDGGPYSEHRNINRTFAYAGKKA